MIYDLIANFIVEKIKQSGKNSVVIPYIYFKENFGLNASPEVLGQISTALNNRKEVADIYTDEHGMHITLFFEFAAC